MLTLRIGLVEEAPVQDCWLEVGRVPISTKWVGANKVTQEHPDVRCRQVARNCKQKGEKERPVIFAAMPSLEVKKNLFRKAALGVRERREGRWQRRQPTSADY